MYPCRQKGKTGIICQKGPEFLLSLPTCRRHLETNLYTFVVDFIYFHCLVKLVLYPYTIIYNKVAKVNKDERVPCSNTGKLESVYSILGRARRVVY